MGRETFSRTAFTASTAKLAVPKSGSVTAKAEEQARETGRLNPLVDPAGYGVIRRSLLRFEEQPNGLWLLTVGTSIPIETRVDTTGSMGSNVDVAMQVLPNLYEACFEVLPGSDIHVATGIFGDVQDRFVLCRPQFEMIADKIVEQLTLMVPLRAGGDGPEDPHYGLFGAAYLTALYINRIGLKSYDFTVSDAPAHELFDESQLRRIFGDEVFTKVTENGYQINPNDLPSIPDVVRDLLKRAHAFFLQVGSNSETTSFWTKIFGANRVVKLPNTEMLPQVQATIIGLTEGTLTLKTAPDFLQRHNIPGGMIKDIVRSVSKIPIGAQAALPNFGKRPKAGDLFKEKTDLWPIDPGEIPAVIDADDDQGGEKSKWL